MQNRTKQVGNCTNPVANALTESRASHAARISSKRPVTAAKGRKARFLASRMWFRRVGSRISERKPFRSSPNMFDIVGPNEKPDSTLAAVAAKSVQRPGQRPFGAAKLIEMP